MITGPDVLTSLFLIICLGGVFLLMLAVIWTAIRMINKIIYEIK